MGEDGNLFREYYADDGDEGHTGSKCGALMNVHSVEGVAVATSESA